MHFLWIRQQAYLFEKLNKRNEQPTCLYVHGGILHLFGGCLHLSEKLTCLKTQTKVATFCLEAGGQDVEDLGTREGKGEDKYENDK